MSPPQDEALRWRPDPRDVSIDIVGACNLACPACGHGNLPGAARPLGAMGLELFDRILDKVVRELAPELPRVHLFNWGEPLLHPQAPAFIRRVKDRGLTCLLSSNLVRPRDLRGVVAAGPDWLRISLSGFTQPVYGQSHRGGDVERVKANMRLLRSLIDELGAPTAVEVNYHQYRHNSGPERAAMEALATSLGFAFTPTWSILGSPEKVLDWLAHGVPEADRPHVERLVHRPEESCAIAARHRDLLAPGECPLRDVLLVNSDGSVDLCCAAYDVPPVVRSYLDASPAEIQAAKRRAPLCGPCMAAGLHLASLGAGKAERDARGDAVLAEIDAAVAALPDPPGAAAAAAEGDGPWRGARRRRVLVVPRLDEPADCLAAVLPAFARSIAGDGETTLAFALPAQALEAPPPALEDLARAGLDLDLVLTPLPWSTLGWQALLAGTSLLLLTSDRPAIQAMASRLGVEVRSAALDRAQGA